MDILNELNSVIPYLLIILTWRNPKAKKQNNNLEAKKTQTPIPLLLYKVNISYFFKIYNSYTQFHLKEHNNTYFDAEAVTVPSSPS